MALKMIPLPPIYVSTSRMDQTKEAFDEVYFGNSSFCVVGYGS
jgi:hypothetical protein|tara:strand:- start:63 stop:191 length:129 start_codon:yes stop_codon:yes gene_type:complete